MTESDLAGRVRSEATLLFVEDRHWAKINYSFGIEGMKKSSACAAFSARANYTGTIGGDLGFLNTCRLLADPQYWRAPRPLKKLIKEEIWDHYSREDLWLFHYPIIRKNIITALEDMAAMDRWFAERNPQQEVLDVQSFLEAYDKKFTDPTMIRMNIFNVSYLIGNRDLMQEVTAYMKEGAENTFSLMRELTDNAYFVEGDKKRAKSVHIYDLISKPKEVHFEL